jgi:hypothetical protein
MPGQGGCVSGPFCIRFKKFENAKNNGKNVGAFVLSFRKM